MSLMRSVLHQCRQFPSSADTGVDVAASSETRRIYDCETCQTHRASILIIQSDPIINFINFPRSCKVRWTISISDVKFSHASVYHESLHPVDFGPSYTKNKNNDKQCS